jgi:Excalibur calcium-binding domain
MTSRRQLFRFLVGAAVAGLAGAAGAQTRTRRSTPQRRRVPASTASQHGPPNAVSTGARNYPDCAVARTANAAPLRRGQPGCREALDPDRDGVACEVGE